MADFELKLTDEQYEAIKTLTKFAEKFSDQVLKVMKRTGLDKLKGNCFTLDVDTQYHSITQTITYGEYTEDSEVGYVSRKKGDLDLSFCMSDNCSPEYEIIFADEDTKSRIRNLVSEKKDFPPDGLWVSDADDSSFLDGGQ